MYDEAWRYERFISAIEQQLGMPWTGAERTARATLETLAERLDASQAHQLADDLPQQLARWLLDGGPHGQRFDVAEFGRRVAQREGVAEPTAAEHARAVFVALARLVRKDELKQLADALPRDFRLLLGEALRRPRDPSAAELMSIEEFTRRVADRAGSDAAGAVRAIDAVLETLAERLAAGEVEDMIEVLPPELRAPLQRGIERGGRKAIAVSVDEFVERVADREGLSTEQALDHVRAVFSTLRDALPDKEWSDLLSELPRRYQEELM
jgi:uncharacterized protein (DUF2267 family)